MIVCIKFRIEFAYNTQNEISLVCRILACAINSNTRSKTLVQLITSIAVMN